MGSQTEKQFEAAKQSLIRTSAICLAAIFAAFLLPKEKIAMNQFRFFCTLLCFGGLVGLGLQMLKPRERTLSLFFAQRYQSSPPSLEPHWKRYLSSLNRLIGALAGIYLVLVASIALRVLSARVLGDGPWISSLAGLNSEFRLLYYLALAALLLFPFYMGGVITDVAQRRQMLREQEELTGWSEEKEVRERERGQSAKPIIEGRPAGAVTVRPGGAFRAGEMEWQWSDLVKNCIIFGQTGSGKTICVLNALLHGIMGTFAKSEYPVSALVLDPKGDFSEKLEKLCKRYGRSRDFLILDPSDMDRTIRWNPFDSDDDELELASRFAAVLEAMGSKNEGDTFWIDSAKKFIRHAIALVRLTNREGFPPSFRAIAELASNHEAIVDRIERLDVTDERCEQCLSYFVNEWLRYPDETRAGIQGNITNMVDPFLMPPYQELFSGRSTLRVGDMLEEGKILYVNMPIADKEAMSRMICTFLKLEYFREVLKARDKKRPSFFLCDEFQVYFTTSQGKSDADFFERSRQSNHANLIASQNFPALLKVTPKEPLVENLLGNCAVKIFLRNTDPKTNEWASKLFGQRIVGMGGSQSGGGMGKKGVPGMGGGSVSASDQWDHKVRPERFSELAIPNQGEVDYAETIVHLASRPDPEKFARAYKWKVHPLQSDNLT